ncbi:MAG: DUF839 domain-containing protein [Bdellovibrionales bacterium]|nr:DUF839 domain-containing protein [Bdellovibrionales bacterium]
MKQSRKEFLQFLGYTGVSLGTLDLFGALTSAFGSSAARIRGLSSGIAKDEVVTAPGISAQMLISWDDPISKDGTLKFGFNNDYTALIEHSSKGNRAFLWVNHEYPSTLFLGTRSKSKSMQDIEKEMKSVGGSFIEIKKNKKGQWKVLKNSLANFRMDGLSKIPFAYGQKIEGVDYAIGTFANCAGGQTPWGTILTCEENYHDYYGERKEGSREILPGDLGWASKESYPPEHYGWVVEVDPKTKAGVKHISLGRFAHESATVTRAKNGNVVVYSGDDKAGECLYKFVSNHPDSFESGTLYVASLAQKKWIPLDLSKTKALGPHFKNQTDIYTYTRKAAHLAGGTALDRPEDIEIIPGTAQVLIALTNNTKKNNYFGSILKVMEDGDDAASLSFTHDTFIAGGEATGFACPDNLAFDPKGNLWFTTDISGSKMNKEPYASFGNNGLFVVMKEGEHKGKAIQMASAPFDAEFTGPTFTKDGKTLFLSVQHPGENSKSLSELTSHWPEGGNAIPKPSVITLQGPVLEAITS